MGYCRAPLIGSYNPVALTLRCRKTLLALLSHLRLGRDGRYLPFSLPPRTNRRLSEIKKGIAVFVIAYGVYFSTFHTLVKASGNFVLILANSNDSPSDFRAHSSASAQNIWLESVGIHNFGDCFRLNPQTFTRFLTYPQFCAQYFSVLHKHCTPRARLLAAGAASRLPRYWESASRRYTVSPSFTVASTRIRGISSTSTAAGSRSRMTKSARLPGESVPFAFSSKY